MSLFKTLFFVFLCLCGNVVRAQEKFTEGVLRYAIVISGKVPTAANEPALTESRSGTLTIHIKDDNVLQEIRLEDGYYNARISNYTTGKEIVLQTINKLHYAIEVNLSDHRKKNAAFYNGRLEPLAGRQQIAGQAAQEALLRYRDGASFHLFYLGDWRLKHPAIFERTPDLEGIPAVFEIAMSNGFTTRFELQALRVEPVGNAIFRVPEGYRIIGRKEYDKLLR